MSRKPMSAFRGVPFTIEEDEEHGILHWIKVSFECYGRTATIEVSLYGNSRDDAMQKACLELYLIASGHQIRCPECQLYLVGNLLDEYDRPEPGEEGTP